MPRKARVDSPGIVTRVAEIHRLTPFGPLKIFPPCAKPLLAIVVAAFCFGCRSDSRSLGHNINGVTARFEIMTPTIRFGEVLKVTALYRNESSQTLVFRFLPPIYDAKVFRNGVEELPCTNPEVPYTEVEL